MQIILYFNILLGMLFLYGCTSLVGDKCIYGKQLTGNAIIKSIDEKNCIIDFLPSNRVWAEWSVEEKFQNINAKCFGKIEVGKVYNAVYKQEIQGSCKPYELIVYTQDFLKIQPNFSNIYDLKIKEVRK